MTFSNNYFEIDRVWGVILPIGPLPAGDFNGDGFEDLFRPVFVNSPTGTSVTITFGDASGVTPIADLASFNGVNGFVIDVVTEFAGVFVILQAVDVNNDGIDDIIFGDSRFDVNALTNSGRVSRYLQLTAPTASSSMETCTNKKLGVRSPASAM